MAMERTNEMCTPSDLSRQQQKRKWVGIEKNIITTQKPIHGLDRIPMNTTAFETKYVAKANRRPIGVLHSAVTTCCISRHGLDHRLVGSGHLHHGVDAAGQTERVAAKQSTPIPWSATPFNSHNRGWVYLVRLEWPKSFQKNEKNLRANSWTQKFRSGFPRVADGVILVNHFHMSRLSRIRHMLVRRNVSE
jgi:hypothetical protein